MPTEIEATISDAVVQSKRAAQARLVSLDVFRGASVAAMILVNDPGDRFHIYWPLEHAQWDGWTPTDLIFPFFLFILGVSIVLSFNSRRLKGATTRELLVHSLRRSAIIFSLGLFLSAYPFFDLQSMRILGVLQRIALVYLASSVIVLYANRNARYAVCLAILLCYWGLITLVPVPGYGPGVLTVNGSLAGYIDRKLMYNHLAIPHQFDPEGLLTTFPAIASCLFGVFAGEWLSEGSDRIRKLLVGALVFFSFGYVWGKWLPINKHLWTSSYALLTAGVALAVLAFCYWVIDARGWRRWAQPFIWYGANPLAMYCAAVLVAHTMNQFSFRGVLLKEMFFQKVCLHISSDPYFASMLYGLSYVSLFCFVSWVMFRKKVFISV